MRVVLASRLLGLPNGVFGIARQRLGSAAAGSGLHVLLSLLFASLSAS